MADEREEIEGMTPEEEFVMHFPVHYQDFRRLNFEQRRNHLLERIEAAAGVNISVQMMEVALEYLFGRRDTLEQLRADNNVPQVARDAAANVIARLD